MAPGQTPTNWMTFQTAHQCPPNPSPADAPVNIGYQDAVVAPAITDVVEELRNRKEDDDSAACVGN